MTSALPAWHMRHARTIENAFVVFCAALFVWSLADWLGVLPFEPGYKPLRMLLLSSALLAQAVGNVARRRSLPLFYVFLGASMLLLVGSFVATN